MTARAAWVGRSLTLLGLATIAVSVVHAPLWGMLCGAGGFLVAIGLTFERLVRGWVADERGTRPSDFRYMMDLFRRAHGGLAAWGVGLAGGDIEVAPPGATGRDARRRGAAIVQLASVDGRAHVTRDAAGTFVAVGDFPFGAGILLAASDTESQAVESVVEELRRLVAGMRVAEPPEQDERADLVAKQLSTLASGTRTLEGVAKAGAELAEQITQRGTAIVLRGGGTAAESGVAAGALGIVAASSVADKRLVGLVIADHAPVAHAIHAGIPVVAREREDVLGVSVADRRRQDRGGTAYPLMDGRLAIGALVVLGGPIGRDGPTAHQLQRLLHELGARLGAARAVHEAEQRAVLDPLTSLRNRRELERRVSRHKDQTGPATLVYLDLDRFKALNDTLGHVAGDGALRHVAGILQGAVRDQDLAARIGGEEFAVWMPSTPLSRGLEVAERIRQAIESTVWRWNGTPYPLTASCGVAGFPETVADVNNLQGAADAALYRAKRAGRNRVEMATPGR